MIGECAATRTSVASLEDIHQTSLIPYSLYLWYWIVVANTGSSTSKCLAVKELKEKYTRDINIYTHINIYIYLKIQKAVNVRNFITMHL